MEIPRVTADHVRLLRKYQGADIWAEIIQADADFDHRQSTEPTDLGQPLRRAGQPVPHGAGTQPRSCRRTLRRAGEHRS